ncbi:zinc ribbon domain-containing protein [Thermogemmatispora carboxidivorans]|uniref:zinc ribbon domain-containing protein n=1 Tax=Thermogemmatispora carboxidivorans TaxID=1382306 RepID=UPI0006995249|nr:zinc ribbon domain-containing protein [Thermogemmatispora carboxidivorans]
MQRCPHCGATLPADAYYCGRCGLPVYGATPHEPTERADAGAHAPGPALDPTRQAGPEPVGPYQGTVPAVGSDPYAMTKYGTPPYGVGPETEPAGKDLFTPPPPPPSSFEYPPLYPIPPAGRNQRPLRRPSLMLIGVVLVVVLVVGGVLVALNLLHVGQGQPQLRVSSAYHVGSLPAGATGTSLQVSGQQFASDSQVTFYLDGQPLPGVNAKTDSNGALNVKLSVTSGWKLGQHTLTAADASSNRVQEGVTVVIVPQGQAHTPGPNGAPPDDASFKIAFTASNGSATQSGTFTVTGHPDPAGGTVCATYANGMKDDGQPHTLNGVTSSGIRYQETLVATCQGTYRGGKIIYKEIYNQDQVVFQTSQGNVTCTTAPHTVQAEGSFVDATHVKGTLSGPAYSYSCDNGNSSQVQASTGTWEGQLLA